MGGMTPMDVDDTSADRGGDAAERIIQRNRARAAQDAVVTARLGVADELTAAVRHRLYQAVADGRDLTRVDIDLFVDALLDAVIPPARPLTAPEESFAVSAGVPFDAFSASRAARNAAYVLESARADEAEIRSWLTSSEVAALVGIDDARVRWMVDDRRLLAVRRPHRELRLPAWQFENGRLPPPEMRSLLRALPADFDVLSRQRVLLEPDEELDGLSPWVWLQQGRPLLPLVTWARELSWF
jgi:hypothetical protein